HHMKTAFFLECSTNLLAYTPHVRKIEIAVELRRRAHTDKRKIRIDNCLAGIRGRAQITVLYGIGNHLTDIFFDDRRHPLIDKIHLGLVWIHANHLVVVRSQTSCRNRTHITQPENTDFHLYPFKSKFNKSHSHSFTQCRTICSMVSSTHGPSISPDHTTTVAGTLLSKFLETHPRGGHSSPRARRTENLLSCNDKLRKDFFLAICTAAPCNSTSASSWQCQ